MISGDAFIIGRGGAVYDGCLHGIEEKMLTLEGIRAAEFDPITSESKIAARFHRLEVFRVLGLTLDDAVLVRHSGKLRGITFDVALGNSVNNICRALLVDDLVDALVRRVE